MHADITRLVLQVDIPDRLCLLLLLALYVSKGRLGTSCHDGAHAGASSSAGVPSCAALREKGGFNGEADQQLIAVHDGVDAVRDDEQRAPPVLAAPGLAAHRPPQRIL
jgi:hypothetical protein